ncbi:hypothetical protein B0H11DRAFT_1910085 [Mycena galericulata]|nr:hypothetical protein B0H11DRAFT_1910085 [Mycena galericulata]
MSSDFLVLVRQNAKLERTYLHVSVMLQAHVDEQRVTLRSYEGSKFIIERGRRGFDPSRGRWGYESPFLLSLGHQKYLRDGPLNTVVRFDATGHSIFVKWDSEKFPKHSRVQESRRVVHTHQSLRNATKDLNSYLCHLEESKGKDLRYACLLLVLQQAVSLLVKICLMGPNRSSCFDVTFGASLSPRRQAGDSRREAWDKLPKKDYVFKTVFLSHFSPDFYDAIPYIGTLICIKYYTALVLYMGFEQEVASSFRIKQNLIWKSLSCNFYPENSLVHAGNMICSLRPDVTPGVTTLTYPLGSPYKE